MAAFSPLVIQVRTRQNKMKAGYCNWYKILSVLKIFSSAHIAKCLGGIFTFPVIWEDNSAPLFNYRYFDSVISFMSHIKVKTLDDIYI